MAFLFMLLAFLLAHVLHFAVAAPHQRRSVTPLTSAELAGLVPFTQFARAAYCPASMLRNWRCGEACATLSDFQPTLVGGDGNAIQTFFVGFWKSHNTIVVAHQGTDPIQVLSVLTDINILTDNLDAKLFPGVPSSAQVHDGFRNQQALTGPVILAEVRRLMAEQNVKSVTLVGHSLGGALAEIDALFLTLNLPVGTAIQAVTFGTPRVGNIAFASLIDSKVPNFKRINNKADPIPTVPGRFLGFSHPHGEVHLMKPGDAIACPGDDDTIDSQCQIRTVPTILQGNILDHLGPYEGVSIGSIFCT